MEENTRGDIASNLFFNGYNCTQAVVLSFKDKLGLPEETLSKISCSFGGGMGRLREVCGAFSGMLIVLGLLYGYDGPETGDIKKAHYEKVQLLAKRFEEKNGTIICRKLLNLDVTKDTPTPEPRTPDYYKKRPCNEIIRNAADILDEFIKENEKRL